jgi:sugar-specific transcriptional regulator TrmB
MEGLEKAGLTKNESKVYSTLIDLGPSLAGQIARKSGLHRRTVYDTTEMLIQKGLLGYILKNNRRLFKAEHPNRLLEILQEKQDSLSPTVESLTSKYLSSKEKEETNFYKGVDGLKSVFESQLNEKEILILGASSRASEVLKYYLKWYHKKRVRRKIKTRIIAQSRKMGEVKHAEVRFLPEKYMNPVSVNIWGKNLAIILWAKEPLAIVIKSAELAEGYKNYFELMWKIAKE